MYYSDEHINEVIGKFLKAIDSDLTCNLFDFENRMSILSKVKAFACFCRNNPKYSFEAHYDSRVFESEIDHCWHDCAMIPHAVEYIPKVITDSNIPLIEAFIKDRNESRKFWEDMERNHKEHAERWRNGE